MQGIRDSIQPNNNNKQIGRSVEELKDPSEILPEWPESIFKKPSLGERISYCAEDEDTLLGLSIGTGITVLAAGKVAENFYKLPKSKVAKVNEAIDEVLNNKTNLCKKGLKIVNLTSMDAPELKDFSKREKRKYKDFVKGKNACFATSNKIYVNREKMALSTFHEMGHAYDFNNTKLKNIMRHPDKFMIAAICTAFLPILIRETWKLNLTTGEKIKNGIRSATPLISGAAFLPIVIEEARASINASRFAKPLLEKGVYKKMVKGNVCGFATYLLSMLSLMCLAQYHKTVFD